MAQKQQHDKRAKQHQFSIDDILVRRLHKKKEMATWCSDSEDRPILAQLRSRQLDITNSVSASAKFEGPDFLLHQLLACIFSLVHDLDFV